MSDTDVRYHLYEMAKGRRIATFVEVGPAVAVWQAIEYVEGHQDDDPVIVACGVSAIEAPEQIEHGAELVALGFHIRQVFGGEDEHDRWYTTVGPWEHP